MRKDKHLVVCLIGSTKPEWKARYRFIEEILTMHRILVIGVVWFKDELHDFEKYRKLLESIHYQKIRMSDIVVLIHPEAIGKHTRIEHQYALKMHKPVITYTTISNFLKAIKEKGI